MNKSLILFLLIVIPGPAWAQSSAQLVDPLRPSHYQPQPPAEVQLDAQPIERLRDQLQLTVILTSAERTMAVINGRPLQVDQTISGFRLVRIGVDSVDLRKGEQTLTLHRTISGVKKSPAQKQ
ncbi:hypothetical protein [Pelovirga terrestris]|uniref:MSHA biogenesis protein MshK n=1 Tax=Pelovirga terrestris TaxID=2771352 RepID=A0A8J6QMK4_9BACT|nr:hypothetical protein [Pelovirga terrestris]MBD1401419.1 hypothetical protein [Pelovirga terrestris]